MPNGSEVLFVSCTPGLEPALAAEARALSGKVKTLEGGVELEGSRGLYAEANLRLRTATRVLLRVERFSTAQVKDARAVFERLDMSAFLLEGAPVTVHVSVNAPGLRKEALVRAAKDVWNAQPTSDEAPDEVTAGLWIRADEEQVTVSVDTSGTLLHRRGYRQEISRAPLRETLAAGMLVLAGYDGTVPLWDFMCGSGTLPIEGAWMATGRLPGEGRVFAYESFPRAVAAPSAPSPRKSLSHPIWATDLHAGALGTARRNARRAGVQELLHFERLDALKAEPKIAPGLLVANLPYGVRVGDRAELAPFHRQLGEAFRSRFQGWRAAFLTASGDFEKDFGQEPAAVHPVMNGGIRCRLLVFGP